MYTVSNQLSYHLMKYRNEKTVNRLKKSTYQPPILKSDNNSSTLINELKHPLEPPITLSVLFTTLGVIALSSLGIAAIIAVVYYNYLFWDEGLDYYLPIEFLCLVTFILFLEAVPTFLINYLKSSILNNPHLTNEVKLDKLNNNQYLSPRLFQTLRVILYISYVLFISSLVYIAISGEFIEGLILSVILFYIISGCHQLMNKVALSDWLYLLMLFFAIGLNLFILENFTPDADEPSDRDVDVASAIINNWADLKKESLEKSE